MKKVNKSEIIASDLTTAPPHKDDRNGINISKNIKPISNTANQIY